MRREKRAPVVLLWLWANQGAYPDELYPIIWPVGRYTTQRDCGSSKGGPCKAEYAVNMYMGRLAKLGHVCRVAFRDDTEPPALRGKWILTAAGKSIVRGLM